MGFRQSKGKISTMNRRNLRSLKRRRERRRFLLTMVSLLLVASAGCATYLLIKHYLLVKEIVVIGNQHLRNEEIGSLIKIRKNDALFGHAGKEIYKELLKSPWIKDAIVRKELSGKVIIRITEAVPVAILNLSEKAYLVDKEGAILEQMREGSVLLLPIINEIDPANNRVTYLEAIKMVNILHEKRALSYSGKLEITGNRPEEISLKLDNILIKIGVGNIEKKLERLRVVKEEIERRNMLVEYVDLRFNDKIIVKPITEVPEKKEKPVKTQLKTQQDGKKQKPKKKKKQ